MKRGLGVIKPTLEAKSSQSNHAFAGDAQMTGKQLLGTPATCRNELTLCVSGVFSK
jgi:hypothetical protein